MKDDAVINFFVGKNVLSDSELQKVIIEHQIDHVSVSLVIKSRLGASYDIVEIIFSEVTEFRFDYDYEMGFVDLWEVKFVKLEDGTYYLCLDPDPATAASNGVVKINQTEDDGFYVRSKHVVVKSLN